MSGFLFGTYPVKSLNSWLKAIFKRKFYQLLFLYSYCNHNQNEVPSAISVTNMEDIKNLRGLLKKIRDSAAVTDALLMTKTGMFVLGSMRRSTSIERFLGMSAILMGSAEAFSIELKDTVKGVVVRTKNSKIAIVAVTNNVILVVKYFGKKDDHQILEELQEIIGSNQYGDEG